MTSNNFLAVDPIGPQYSVIYAPSALKDFNALDSASLQEDIATLIAQLVYNPYPLGSKLSQAGDAAWELYFNSYRIEYQINPAAEQVRILRIHNDQNELIAAQELILPEYQVIWTKSALKAFNALADEKLKQRIEECVEPLKYTPHPHGYKQLKQYKPKKVCQLPVGRSYRLRYEPHPGMNLITWHGYHQSDFGKLLAG